MNIFQISQELLDIFSELEENGGELTEELERQLAITQADFKDKIKSYTDVIKYTKSEIKLIDEEVDRLKGLKDSKNKAIARLEKVIIWAIDMFGESNKSGNKFVDFGTGKVSIRNTEKVEVNDDFAKEQLESFIDEIKSFARSKELYENPIQDLMSYNKDLDGISADITFTVSAKDLFDDTNTYDSKLSILRILFSSNTDLKAKPSISKTALKEVLELHPDAYPDLAHIVPNKTLSIK